MKSKTKADNWQAQAKANLVDETAGARLYDALAEAESNPDVAKIYSRLARIEESHADFWRRKLEEAGATAGELAIPFRTRALIWMARRFGPAFILPAVRAAEMRDGSKYNNSAETAHLAAQEQGHARVLSGILNSGENMDGPQIRKLEGRHRGGGNSLRAAVLGANDGLLSNFSLVMGVAGGASDHGTLVLAGLAGLVAGAFSMALGEWLSVTNARELFERQIAVEREELETNPEEEREELSLIYQSKGIPEAEAEALANQLISNRDAALDTLSREELGIDPHEMGGSAMVAAGTSFALFSLGAVVPLGPLLVLQGNTAITASAIASGCGLLLLGAMTSMLTGQSLLRGSVRQLLIGAAAAGITFAIGRILGVAIGG